MTVKKKILAVGLIWTSLWLALEVFLRLFGYGNFIIYSPDPKLLWIPNPNQKGKTVVGREPLTINGQRLRYPIDIPLRNGDEYRVFAFGDSVTMGWGVDDGSHYSAVLENLLVKSAEEDRTFRVISAGVNAYPTALCVRRFSKMLADGYQIDAAILAYSFNRNHEPLAHLQGESRDNFLKKVRLKGIVRRSAVYNFVIEDWLRQAVYYRVRDHFTKGSWDTDDIGESNGDRPTRYLDSLNEMLQLCEQNRVKLIFLLLGSNGQRNELGSRQKQFYQFAKTNEIPLVNMVERLDRKDHEKMFSDHVHTTALGHLEIAQGLFPVVVECSER